MKDHQKLRLICITFCIFLIFYIYPSIFKLNYSSNLPQYDKLDDYIAIHANIVRNNLTHNIVHSDNRKYGYGNRVYRVLNALTIAILSDSACYVTWEINESNKTIESYFDSPLPEFFNSYSKKAKLFEKYNFTVVLDEKEIVWPEVKDIKQLTIEIPTMEEVRLTVLEERALFFLICTNPKYYQKLLSYDLVTNKTIERALEFEKLTDERLKQESQLQIGFEVAGRLLNKFFIPSSYIRTQIDNFISEKFSGYFVIGIQLRSLFVKESDLDVFTDCAMEIEYQLYANEKNKSQFKPVKWFITSDNSTLIDRISTKYNDKVIKGVGDIGHVDENSNVYYRTVLDNELSSHCHEYIFTAGSTYGFIPVIRSQKLSYYVIGAMGSKKCEKMTLSRPGHNHFYFSTF